MTARRNGSHARVKRESSRGDGAPDPLLALQQQLTRQLQQTVEDTVGAVCDNFQHELRQLQARAGKSTVTVPAAAKLGAASTADYEMYYSCCKQLVAYIAANMTTSPDFAAQMDRIILACHSKAPEHVLRTVATKNVWFHRRDGAGAAAAAAESVSETDDDAAATARPTPAASKRVSPRVPKTEHVSPARPVRAARKAAEVPVPTRTAASKRRSPAVASPPVAKRQRPTRRSLPLPDYEDDDEDEEEEEEEVVEEVDDDDDDDDADAAVNQPHLDVSDELLDFKDAVRDLCYVDKRTPAQTKFFKERLRKAILFVDAQLCKPPPGQVCRADCKKLRSVMCDRTLPCRNKICRVWHDVEVHIDQCANPHCELKNRIMLRETMHKIDHKRLQIASARREVTEKTHERDALVSGNSGGMTDRDALVDHALLTNELEQLENEIAAAEEELGILTGTKKAFWACLNVVGIELKDDVADGFPDLAAHYVAKKPPVPKRASKDTARVPQHPTTLVSSSAPIQQTTTNASMHRSDDPMAPIKRRTTRRSTAKTFQAMAMDADSVESEDGSSGAKSVEAEDQVDTAPAATDANPSVVAPDNASPKQPVVDTQGLDDLSTETFAQTESQVVVITDERHTTVTTTVATISTSTSSSSTDVDTARAIVTPLAEPLPSPVNNIEILPSIGATSNDDAYAQLLAAAAAAEPSA